MDDLQRWRLEGFPVWGVASDHGCPLQAMVCPQRCAGSDGEERQTKPVLASLCFRIIRRQLQHEGKKHGLSLPKVILMGTDVFMVINKISKAGFYRHTETLKSHSLP